MLTVITKNLYYASQKFLEFNFRDFMQICRIQKFYLSLEYHVQGALVPQGDHELKMAKNTLFLEVDLRRGLFYPKRANWPIYI
jgi:hypothetical protein